MPEVAPTTVLEAVNLHESERLGAQLTIRPDGLRCSECGVLGTLVSAFGPELANHLVMLDARFQSNPTD